MKLKLRNWICIRGKSQFVAPSNLNDTFVDQNWFRTCIFAFKSLHLTEGAVTWRFWSKIRDEMPLCSIDSCWQCLLVCLTNSFYRKAIRKKLLVWRQILGSFSCCQYWRISKIFKKIFKHREKSRSASEKISVELFTLRHTTLSHCSRVTQFDPKNSYQKSEIALLTSS
jgi:hypothetical protein